MAKFWLFCIDHKILLRVLINAILCDLYTLALWLLCTYVSVIFIVVGVALIPAVVLTQWFIGNKIRAYLYREMFFTPKDNIS